MHFGLPGLVCAVGSHRYGYAVYLFSRLDSGEALSVLRKVLASFAGGETNEDSDLGALVRYDMHFDSLSDVKPYSLFQRDGRQSATVCRIRPDASFGGCFTSWSQRCDRFGTRE